MSEHEEAIGRIQRLSNGHPLPAPRVPPGQAAQARELVERVRTEAKPQAPGLGAKPKVAATR